jgi:hypothetical protein
MFDDQISFIVIYICYTGFSVDIKTRYGSSGPVLYLVVLCSWVWGGGGRVGVVFFTGGQHYSASFVPFSPWCDTACFVL